MFPATIASAGQSTIVSTAAVTPRLARGLKLNLDAGIVISPRVWQSEFHSKADVRGEQIRVDGVALRVGGVAPDGVEGMYRDRPVDLWIPFEEEIPRRDPSSRNLWILGRLRAGVSMDQARMALGERRRSPRGSSGFASELDPPRLSVFPYTGLTPDSAEGTARVGTLLRFAAALVFFIACANVAVFLVGRSSARSHESSLRVALGAGRRQLARGLLADSVVISISGGASGALLAVWTSRLLPALLFEEDAERMVFAPDLFTTLAVAAACTGIMIACGLVPMFVTSHDRPATVLQREGSGPSKTIQRLHMGLVVAQMSACCLLVISTAFLFEGLRAALQTQVGRRLGHPILASVQADLSVGLRYFRDVQRATRPVAGVSALAWAAHLPGALPTWQSFRIEPQHMLFRDVTMDLAHFTADTLALFTLPPVAGHLFNLQDRTCRAAIVNESAAEVLFGRDTIGRSLRDPLGVPVAIVGVIAMHNTGSKRPMILLDDAAPRSPTSGAIARATFKIPAAPRLAGAQLDSNVVSASYFAAVGWPLVAGRLFDEAAAGGCRVAVVNQEAADLYFNGDAVGAAVIDDGGRRTEVIGVVHAAPLVTFQRRVEPTIYFPMAQDFPPRMTLILTARQVNSGVLHALTGVIEAVPGHGPAPPIVQTLDTYLGKTALAQLRIATMIVGASGTIALLLSILGLFGALSDAVRQRRRELAIRIALGAPRRHVVGRVLGEGGRLAGAGILAGTLASLLLSQTLARITPGNHPPALWIWMAAPLLLAVSVALAGVIPARRALLVDPLTILREEN
jgi:ABC-type lipoprotein release transport system permease subunit